MLAEETAVAIQINGINYVVMMLTPHDLDDFVVGYLLTQGIIDHVYDIHNIEHSETDVNYVNGIRLNVLIANRQAHRFSAKIRHMQGSSGCGICGTKALEDAFKSLPNVPRAILFDSTLLIDIRKQLLPYQTRSQASGAMHAACWVNKTGSIEYCREDIGRHNALDKVIGALKKARQPILHGALLVTSRCGAELVQKTIVAGISTLISLSSPSDLALLIARRHKLTLIHVLKKERPIVYLPDLNSDNSNNKISIGANNAQEGYYND